MSKMFGARSIDRLEMDLLRDRRVSVADMRQIVHGHATHVHPHTLRLERCEALLAAAQAVVQKERVHGILLQISGLLGQTGG